MVQIQPPKIIHLNRPLGHTEMVIAAAKNVRLNSRPLRLLLFLEDRSNGFRPSQKWIEKNTGIAANKISEVRNELVQHGMIGYGNGIILFDWNRMRTYAALLEPLPKIGNHQPISVSSVYRYRRTEPTIGMLIKTRKKETLSIRDLLMLDTPDEEYHEQTIYDKCFFKALYKMTVNKWTTICRLFPEYNPPSYTIDDDNSKEHLLSIEFENDCIDETDNTDFSKWIISEDLPF